MLEASTSLSKIIQSKTIGKTHGLLVPLAQLRRWVMAVWYTEESLKTLSKSQILLIYFWKKGIHK